MFIRNLKVCRVDLNELIVLLSLRNRSRLTSTSSLIIVFEAQWNLHKQYSLDKLFTLPSQSGIDDIESSPNEIVYMLITNGNDDIEDFIIGDLNIKNLPHAISITPNDSIFKRIDVSNISTSAMLQRIWSSIQSSTSSSSSLSSTITPTPMQLFVAGDRSSVGKSSICLCILATLIFYGISPSDIAYIKPVTQCEAEQPITRFCQALNIEERSIGPVVFYTGFTRAFLAGQTDNSLTLLHQVRDAVTRISEKKKFVLIDGVGYPSVGSICGLSNADVAVKLKCPVVLVGKSGIGDAVDSHNLNSSFFEARSVRVLGAIFNKLSTDLSSFYNLISCGEAVRSYFTQYKTDQKVYGFIPLINLSIGTTATTSTTTTVVADGVVPNTDDSEKKIADDNKSDNNSIMNSSEGITENKVGEDESSSSNKMNTNNSSNNNKINTNSSFTSLTADDNTTLPTTEQITQQQQKQRMHSLQTALNVASGNNSSNSISLLFQAFLQHVDIEQLMADVWKDKLDARAVSVYDLYTSRHYNNNSSSSHHQHHQHQSSSSSSSTRNRNYYSYSTTNTNDTGNNIGDNLKRSRNDDSYDDYSKRINMPASSSPSSSSSLKSQQQKQQEPQQSHLRGSNNSKYNTDSNDNTNLHATDYLAFTQQPTSPINSNTQSNINNNRVRTREEILQSAAQSGACVTGG